MDEISDLLKSGKYEEKTSNAPVILSEELVGLVGDIVLEFKKEDRKSVV